MISVIFFSRLYFHTPVAHKKKVYLSQDKPQGLLSGGQGVLPESCCQGLLTLIHIRFGFFTGIR